MPSNEIMSMEGQLVGMPLAGPESFSQQQLDYLKRALGVDETVLWTGSQQLSAAVNITGLSETMQNFEFIRIHYKGYGTHSEQTTGLIATTVSDGTNNTGATLFMPYLGGSGTIRINIGFVVVNGTTLEIQSPTQVYIKAGDTVKGGNNNASITKIVGIKRIAGGY